MKSIIIKIITIIFLTFLFTGCYVANKPLLTRNIYQKTCWKGDKEAIWNELVKWKDVMYQTRRDRVKYCIDTNDIEYLAYCIEVEEYHTKVENLVIRLQEQHANICSPEDLY